MVRFNDKMQERHARFTTENPNLPYIPLDITKVLGKIEPDSGEMVSAFPGAELTNDIQMVRFGFNTYSSTDPNSASYSGDTTTNNRGSREAPEADLELTQLEWTAVNEGWGDRFEVTETGNPPVPAPGNQYSYGGFQVGKVTTFTATITKHDSMVPIKNVKVNFTIVDNYSGTPMQRNPATYFINITGVTAQVKHDFLTPFAGIISATCTIDYIADTDTSNNGVRWYGMPVFIWSADFESDGTNWGWQKPVDGTAKDYDESEWTGDINNSANAKDIWHITDSPTNQEIEQHTQTDAWFHGEDRSGQDTYSDEINRNIDSTGRNHTYIETPKIDMGKLKDGQEDLGELGDNSYYRVYVPRYSPLITGELENEDDLEESDVLWINEVADNKNGDNWKEKPFPYDYITGDYSRVLQGQITPHWNPIFTNINSQTIEVGNPFTVFVGDGQGGTKYIGGVQNWSNARFRFDFSGDGENDQIDETGLCLDDFATWGVQEYTVENRVGFTEVTYPKTNDVSILYEDSTASFSTRVRNYGKSQQVSVKASIYEWNEWESLKLGDLVFEQEKSAGNLGTDQESSDILFSWAPEKEGDYKLIVVAGDYKKDWTPADNKVEYILNVSSDMVVDVEILVVDDDDSLGQGGIFVVNTEFRMLQALKDNDLKYRVFTVEYNETGPDLDTMDDYELVIWMTGLDNEYTAHAWRDNYNKKKDVWDITLKAEDEEELELFLSNPIEIKKLWLISPGYLYDKYGDGNSITAISDFASIYLKVDRCNANNTEKDQNGDITTHGTPNPLEGVPDSCMDGAEYPTYEDPPSNFDDIGGWVEKAVTDEITHYLFYQDEVHYNYNSLHYKGKDFMSAYFAFNFYMISKRSDRADCVERLLTCSGMMGGVKIEPFNNQEKIKTIFPGQECKFRLSVKNTGKRDDNMTLSVTKDPKYSEWDTWFEIDGVEKDMVRIKGLEKYSKVYLHAQSPVMLEPEEYTKAGTLIELTVTAESDNTGLDNSTKIYAQMVAAGNISISCVNTEKNLDVNETVEFIFQLLNETNGNDEVEVRLSFKGKGTRLAKFIVDDIPKTTTEVSSILEPNKENYDIKLQVKTDSHTLAGYHNITVDVKDEQNTLLDWLDLSVFVNQFYQVKCTTEGELETEETNFDIDPNKYYDDEFIKKSFLINVQNFGNGIDNIKLDYEENDDSEPISNEWRFAIVSPDDESHTLSQINVSYYDENNIPKYGEEQVHFDVYIPLNIRVGNYIVDFLIESSSSEIFYPLKDEEENNRVSFAFNIIKPNLRFIKINEENNTDNFEFRDYNTNLKIEQDLLTKEFYIEKKHKDFNNLVIEFKVSIFNTGSTDIEMGPSDILLSIYHFDEFGDIVYDVNLTPVTPVNSRLISPGESIMFTFHWDNIAQRPGTEVEYTFEITVDPLDEIQEVDEEDNSDKVPFTIKHLPKEGDNIEPIDYGMIIFVIIILVIAVLIVIYLIKSRPVKKKPAEDE